MRMILLRSALLLLPMVSLGAQSAAPVVAPELIDGMRWRMVGPHRGGRSTAIAGVPGQPHTFYAGYTGGGVWRTDDAGTSWTPLTDAFFDNGNVGAIGVAGSDPNVIYVGLGSASIRGNVSVGTGVWKSTDAGATWRYLGLPESGAIGKLAVHPTNPDVVFVAALGHPFGKNPERGVYRTTDGGASWQHVLALNDSTGAVSIVMAPDDPQELWVGMWRAERKPWTLISGGPEGGLYRTRDGGDHWTKVGGGLPTGMVGKVGVTQSPADPNRLWVLIEAEPDGGLYRSDDRGERWTKVNTEARVRGRPFYYTHVRADPQDRDRVYVLNVPLLRSTDGGVTFTPLPVPHGDVHDIWINPGNNGIFGVADDGGAVVTVNDGRTFSSMYNQPTAELYDVQVDDQHPYRIYGSQQDNTAISVLHRRLHNSLRPQEEWNYAAGCETGPVAVHPARPEVIWGGCYGGLINRYDRRDDTRVSVKGWPEATAQAPKDLTNRWQWVAPIVVSPHDTLTIFHASQYLYRSRDGGDSWTRISPDLTTNDARYQAWPGGPISPDNTGVEIFTTIFAVSPSPHDARTIWVGTDDGRVHITRDDGSSWRDITPRDMPVRGTVNRIEVSPHAAGRAFLAVQRYREDDQAPYIFRTDDFGATWQRLTDGGNGIPARHWVRVVREDPEQRGLLYAGTEFGMYVSFDDGAHWQPLQLNLPATPVTDAKVHRGDLVVSTQGRSFWVLDDLTPLRELAAVRAVELAHLFTPRPAARGVVGAPLREVDLTLPDDLPHGALLHFTLARAVQSLTLELRDASGEVVRAWRADTGAIPTTGVTGAPTTASPGSLARGPGLQRVVWNLRGPGPQGGGGQGVKMPPGTYTVRLVTDGVVRERSLIVTGNPRAPGLTAADYDAQYVTALAVRDTISAINATLAWIRRQPEATRARFAAIEGKLVPTRAPGAAVAPAQLLSHYSVLYGTLVGDGGYGSGSAEGRPGAGVLARKADLDAQWSALRAEFTAQQSGGPPPN
jgi:photosystem II stability/assembly factor-like uncharacterized protein